MEMTREEIEKRIDELESDNFYLQMKDMWNGDDYERDRKQKQKIKEYKQMLKEMECMNVDINLYDSLRTCAGDTVNTIEDDAKFCEAEFDLFREWYREKGFTDDDWDYVLACGYDTDQFE